MMNLANAFISQAAIVLSLCLNPIADCLAITKEEALHIANKEIHKLDKVGYEFHKWAITFDEGNREWEKVRSYRKASPVPAAGEYFEKQEAKLSGKEFVTVRYRYDPKPGVEAKDGVG